MSDISTLADAVVTALNGNVWSTPFTAARVWVPICDPNELADLKVSVWPNGLEQTRADRVTIAKRPVIAVVVQKAVSKIDPTELEPLLDIAREINDWLFGQATMIHEGAVLLAITNTPLWHSELLDKSKIFQSILALTFRLRGD